MVKTIEKGYNQTEIGVIPKDWQIRSIKEIAKIITGDRDTQDKTNDGQYPFFVRSNKIEKINSYSFNGEAVLTSGDGVGVGKIYHHINGKFNFHQRVYCMHDFSDCDGIYFYYYFSNNFYNRVMQMTAKSSVDSVRREMISEMLFPLPPLSEQHAIGQVLTDTDQLLQNLKKLIAKKKAIKQGSMQELLIPKEDWKVKELGELTTLITKGTTPTSVGYNFTENGVNFIKVESIDKSGKIKLEKTSYISEECHQVLSRSQIKKGDILFSIAGALGRTAIVKENICPANTNQAVAIIRLIEGVINTSFLYYFFNKFEFQQMLNTISVTGAQPNLSLRNLNNFKIIYPALPKQTAIANVLSDMDLEIEALEKQLHKTEQLKQGLMQELLTGKTRLVAMASEGIKKEEESLSIAAEPGVKYN